MKYTYAYKTSDGVRHEAAMEAASREAVFEQLRSQGIKAIKVVASDGSKANGEVRGVRKRVVAVGAVAIAVGVGVVAFWLGRGRSPSGPHSGFNGDGVVAWNAAANEFAALPMLTAQTRRQVIGDVAVIEKGIRTGWAEVFEDEGERFLASFAIPGVKAGVRSTSVEALEECLREVKSKGEKVKSKERVKVEGEGEQWNWSSSSNAPGTKHQAPSTSLEAQQIIAMVEGMKREARDYIAAGGTAVEYGKRLVERQDAEIALFKRIEAEVLAAQKTMSESEFSAFLDQRNDELRNLGIRPVTLPD